MVVAARGAHQCLGTDVRSPHKSTHAHFILLRENFDTQLEFEGMWEVVRAMEGEQPYMVPVSD